MASTSLPILNLLVVGDWAMCVATQHFIRIRNSADRVIAGIQSHQEPEKFSLPLDQKARHFYDMP